MALRSESVLGMQLADVTPELKSAYDLQQDRGALILDPGPNPDRLKIGEADFAPSSVVPPDCGRFKRRRGVTDA